MCSLLIFIFNEHEVRIKTARYNGRFLILQRIALFPQGISLHAQSLHQTS